MGKVNVDKSQVVAPATETSRSRNESTEKSAARRATVRGTRARSQRSIEPSPDVTASSKIQQLSELNRQIRSAGTSSPRDVERLSHRRDALLAELDAVASVDVTTQADGTVRVRTQEGNLLVDALAPSGEPAGDIAPPPPLPGESAARAAPEPDPVAQVAAVAAYDRVARSAPGDTQAPPVAKSVESSSAVMAPAEELPVPESPSVAVVARSSEVSSGQTGIPLVDQAQNLEAKVEILNRVEVALAKSSTALGSVQSHQDDVNAILG